MDNEIVIDFKKLAMRIKEARHRKGITQEQLATITNLSSNFIGRIESNNSKLSLTSLVKICMALDTSMDYLLSDTIKLPDTAILNITALNDTEKGARNYARHHSNQCNMGH